MNIQFKTQDEGETVIATSVVSSIDSSIDSVEESIEVESVEPVN